MNFVELLEKDLARKEYSQSTVDTYKYWLQQLCDYFPDTAAEEISNDQITEYLSFLVNRKRLSPASVRQAIYSLHWVYNEFGKKGYDIKSFPAPRIPRVVPEILSPHEVLALLNVLTDDKQRLILMVIYSAGLDSSEAANLRVSDIHFNQKRITIKRAYGQGVRTTILSEYVAVELRKYIDARKPTKWLFEGRRKDARISTDAIQKTFKRALRAAHIDKNATVRTLRYSYVKHLEWQGVPLRSILIHLGLLQSDNLRFFTEMEPSDTVVTFSPLDRIILNLSEGRVDTSSLGKMLAKVKNDDEKDYLLESIKCIDSGAYRAGVVFAWTAAIQNIRRRCMNHSLANVNSFIKKHAPKAPDVKLLDDFAYIKDSVVLEICEDLGIYDKSEKAALIECLNLRNRCGHPSKYNPQPHRVTSFIEELIAMVFGKA